MPRNLDRRVEALVPVTDAALRARLDEILKINLADDTLAWKLEGMGRGIVCRGPQVPHAPPAGGAAIQRARAVEPGRELRDLSSPSGFHLPQLSGLADGARRSTRASRP